MSKNDIHPKAEPHTPTRVTDGAPDPATLAAVGSAIYDAAVAVGIGNEAREFGLRIAANIAKIAAETQANKNGL